MLVGTKRVTNEFFRTDAKCADDLVVLAGWEISHDELTSSGAR